MFPLGQEKKHYLATMKARVVDWRPTDGHTALPAVFATAAVPILDVMANITTFNFTTSSRYSDPLTGNFWDGVVLSFSVSVAVGMVIGGMVYILLTCLSRRRASAPISPGVSGRRHRTPSHHHSLNRAGFYRNSSSERRSNLSLASLTFQRQASLEQGDSFSRKPSFRASTFHPFLQCPPIAVEPGSELVALPISNNTSPNGNNTTLSRPEFHWSNNSLRVCNSTQTPPPAYETIIRAFPDSCS
ncbi:myc target protein 1 [Ambystoma mexicanum]|uniref:myc target protein 1 n=1 Tax=Ambystoma mexicanum TaxID=8296 RepID=UPI0037E7DE74